MQCAPKCYGGFSDDPRPHLKGAVCVPAVRPLHRATEYVRLIKPVYKADQTYSMGNFRLFTMHARAPTPVYILGRFCSYMYIHYTPTLQNILYTTYMPALRMAPYGMAAAAAITTFNYSSYSCCGQAGRAIQYSCRAE